jgi:phosphate acetyltransferase
MTSPFLTDRAPVCPRSLLKKAQSLPTPRVAIASAGTRLPMQAARIATETGVMEPVFVGDKFAIRAVAAAIGWDIAKYQIVSVASDEAAARTAATLCGKGEADVLMKGDLHTDTFLKGALSKEADLRTNKRLVHVFHITHPDGGRPLLISDAAVNVAPDLKTRQQATLAVVKLLHQLGNQTPRVAFLSATETPSDAIPSSTEARTLRDWAHNSIKNAHFSGPLALDLALSPRAAEIKNIEDDPVAGQADAIIVPDLTTGNALFKALVYLSSGCAAGIVTGAKVPILLTSRADPPAARLASVALATIAINAKT